MYKRQVYDRFIRVFQKQEKVKMYLASGYCKYHGYDEGKIHFYLFLLLAHPDEPVVYLAAHGKFVVRQKNAGIILSLIHI